MFAESRLLTIKKSSPWKTLDDFVIAVRARSGANLYGTSGLSRDRAPAMEMSSTPRQ